MFKLGLTGGIASGKSTVSTILRELGTPIVDYDQVAKDLQEPHSEVWQKIVETFGREILNSDDSIDRLALGKKVFNNPQAMETLNELMRASIRDRSKQIIRELASAGKKLAVLDVALLIETKMTSIADEVWLVAVPQEVQVDRLMKRNGFTREDALARVHSQMPLTEKIPFADVVIDNSGTVEETRQIVIGLWNDLQHRIALREGPEGIINGDQSSQEF